jgi:hypothetical protein
MLTAIRMVPLRVWNCSLEQDRMQFQTRGINRTAGGASLKTGGRYRSGRKD